MINSKMQFPLKAKAYPFFSCGHSPGLVRSIAPSQLHQSCDKYEANEL
jgi:hypothetical protein